MGVWASRRHAGVEEVDIPSSNAYRYPPKCGCYFGSHFIMGGERFDTTQPETYLFGENQDLNFLGNRPVPFPYPAPQAHEPTKTLKSLVNIRKDSLRLIRVVEDGNKVNQTSPPSAPTEDTNSERGENVPEVFTPRSYQYNLEFTLDSDVRCAITIYYFATEEISNGQVNFHPRDPTMNSETFHYKRGANQTFMQTTHIIIPDKYSEEDWQFNPDKDVIPIVIQCSVEDEAEHVGHSHITYATLEKNSEGGYSIKPLKQKQMVDGLCYLLQEIYGIENKNLERAKRLQEDEIDDSGSECVICMSDLRDTLILPCRHLCLCNCCADSLRYQANNCPICRAPFRALLQIRALRKKSPSLQSAQPLVPAEDNPVSQEGVPQGYEAVSLIEVLNGPNLPPLPPNPLQMPPEGLPPPMRISHSHPTSPEESPVLDKRKMKRQSSVKNRQCIHETCMMKEDAGTEETSCQGTPVIAMAMHPSDPVKSAGSPDTKRKGSGSRACPDSKPSQDSVEIVDEVSKKVEKERKKDNFPQSRHGDSEDADDEYDDEVMAAVMIGATGIDKTLRTSPSPPPDYEDSCEEENIKTTEVTYKPAAHTAVLYDDPDDLEPVPPDQEPLVVTLPSQVMDCISLPGTPVSTTDGSSFSSTCSTRMLLTGQRSSLDDDSNKTLPQEEQ